MTTRRLIRCRECSTPIFELDGGLLIIKNRHGGQRHVTVIPLDHLRALLDEHDAASRVPAESVA